MPALRAYVVVVLAACTPRAVAPHIAHPLGESTAPGPATPPPLATDQQASVQPVTSGLLTGAPAAPVPTAPSSPRAAAPPTSPPVAAQQPATAPVRASEQYEGGTSSTVVDEPNPRIPATPSGVSTETNATNAEPATAPASSVPSGTSDVPATGVLAPPPPSEP